MSELFREVLLNTSRVIWPAEPAGEHVRVTVRSNSRLALTRAYLSLVPYPDERQDPARVRFMTAMEDFTAANVDPDERPPELRHLPRKEAIHSGLRQGLKRLTRALEIASRLSFDIDGAASALAAARTARGVEWAAPVRRQDVMRRTFRPVLPAIHLGATDRRTDPLSRPSRAISRIGRGRRAEHLRRAGAVRLVGVPGDRRCRTLASSFAIRMGSDRGSRPLDQDLTSLKLENFLHRTNRRYSDC